MNKILQLKQNIIINRLICNSIDGFVCGVKDKVKTVVILFILLIGSNISKAQSLEWVKALSDNESMINFSDIAVDNSGNVYVIGEFLDTVDFDPGPDTFNLISYGDKDIFILKLDVLGNLVWAKSVGGTRGDDIGRSLALDVAGNIYLTGSFQGDADFDPNAGGVVMLGSSGREDIFILKLDTAGNLIWAKNMGGVDPDFGVSIAIDNAGNVFTVGTFYNTANFNPDGYYALTGGGTFISKLDALGNFVWAKKLHSYRLSFSHSIAIDFLGNILLNMFYTGSISIDTFDFISQGLQDILVLKLDNLGNLVWAKNMGGPGGDKPYSIAVDDSGNVYSVGEINAPLGGGGSADFDPGSGVFNLQYATVTDYGPPTNSFISKLDSSGNFVWAKKIDGDFNWAYSIDIDVSGNVYVSGYFSDTSDFDPGAGKVNIFPNNRADFYILNLDAFGNFIWAKNIGGLTTVNNTLLTPPIRASIFIDTAKNIYTCGGFNGTVDFDPGYGTFNLTSKGTHFNSFVHKMSPGCVINTYLHEADCDSFIFNGTTYTSGGSYTHTFQTANYCDSVVTLHLTIGADSVIINEIACNSFMFNDTTYNTSGTYIHYFINTSNCDSIVLLNLTINSSSSSNTVTETVCDSFIFNGITLFTTGIYNDTFKTSGCDSIVTLNLTVHNSTSTSLSEAACNSFVFNGNTYTKGGTYVHTFKNSNNCDSIVTLTLSINNDSSTINETSCDSFVFNGTTYINSGIYVHTFTNTNNCDSVVTLNLTIDNHFSATLNETACDSFVFNNTVYRESGIYTISINSTDGCDTIVTLHLEIDSNIKASVAKQGDSLIANNSNGSYQWLDCNNGFTPISGAYGRTFFPTKEGNYAVEVSNNCGADTSDCILVKSSSISDNHLKSQLRLFPNPTNGEILIRTETVLTQATIRLVNILGQVLLEKVNQNGTSFSLDLSPYSSGTYMIELREENDTVREKVIKK